MKTCTGGQYFDFTTQQCHCPQQAPKWDGMKCAPCSSNEFWSDRWNACVSCPEGYHYDFTSHVCLSCPPGYTYNSDYN